MYNNNSGQLSIECLRPDPTLQFSKRSYPTVRQLRQHVASQVQLETSPSHCCDGVIAPRCPYPKPDDIPTFVSSLDYVYNDVAKVRLTLHSLLSCEVFNPLNGVTVRRPRLTYIL